MELKYGECESKTTRSGVYLIYIQCLQNDPQAQVDLQESRGAGTSQARCHRLDEYSHHAIFSRMEWSASSKGSTFLSTNELLSMLDETDPQHSFRHLRHFTLPIKNALLHLRYPCDRSIDRTATGWTVG